MGPLGQKMAGLIPVKSVARGGMQHAVECRLCHLLCYCQHNEDGDNFKLGNDKCTVSDCTAIIGGHSLLSCPTQHAFQRLSAGMTLQGLCCDGSRCQIARHGVSVIQGVTQGVTEERMLTVGSPVGMITC